MTEKINSRPSLTREQIIEMHTKMKEAKPFDKVSAPLRQRDLDLYDKIEQERAKLKDKS